MSLVQLLLPGLRLVSEANAHEHFRLRQQRAADQHRRVLAALSHHHAPTVPAIVRIVRVAPSALDTDNLTGSAKHVRDAVARWLGVDDRDARVTWHVGQAKGHPKEYGVRIHVRPWSPGRVGARVREAGIETLVDVALAPESLRALAHHLAALADGQRLGVQLAVAEVRLSLRSTPGGSIS